jgi:hypothetical protein
MLGKNERRKEGESVGDGVVMVIAGRHLEDLVVW